MRTGKVSKITLNMFFFAGKASSFEEEDGTGIGRNEVKVKLSRGDLASRFVCQAENEAVNTPLEAVINVDVNRECEEERPFSRFDPRYFS